MNGRTVKQIAGQPGIPLPTKDIAKVSVDARIRRGLVFYTSMYHTVIINAVADDNAEVIAQLAWAALYLMVL